MCSTRVGSSFSGNYHTNPKKLDRHKHTSMSPLLSYPVQNNENRCLPGKSYWRGRLSMIDPLIKLTCFCKKVKKNCNSKAADLSQLIQGGKLYWAFPSIWVSCLYSIVTWLWKRNRCLHPPTSWLRQASARRTTRPLRRCRRSQCRPLQVDHESPGYKYSGIIHRLLMMQLGWSKMHLAF